MANDVLYMIAVVAAGFAVNFLLRAFPFLIFAGRKDDLPPWVQKWSVYVSPVIIGILIVYSYSGLEWRAYPAYAAGVLTVALHLLVRNPLVSIICGTALYMALVR